MNQDNVKQKLLSIEDAPLEFSLIYSGKKSKKVNGLYKPATREIIIHNRNFQPDDTGQNLLLYTAIHEYAHHLHACSRGGTLSPRAHNSEFWAIFHALLEKAEKKKIYSDVFSVSPELLKLTDVIRSKFLKNNGELVKEMGKHLLKAHDLCTGIGVRFEDYVDRMLRIPRTAANMAIKCLSTILPPKSEPIICAFLPVSATAMSGKPPRARLLKARAPTVLRFRCVTRTKKKTPLFCWKKKKQDLRGQLQLSVNVLMKLKRN